MVELLFEEMLKMGVIRSLGLKIFSGCARLAKPVWLVDVENVMHDFCGSLLAIRTLNCFSVSRSHGT